MEDFRIPESRYKNMTGGMHGWYGNGNVGSNWNESNSSRTNGDIVLNAIHGYDNEDQSYSFQSRLSGMLSQNSQYFGTRSSVPVHNDKYENSTEGSFFLLSGRYSMYLIPDRTYLYGSLMLNGDYSLSHSRSDTNNVFERLEYHKYRNAVGAVSGGIGIGKTRNASAVFSVVRVLEKLTEDGYLTRELTKEEMIALTEIFAKQVEYSYGYERPIKYFLEDLFKELESMGVLKESKATAYEVVRVEEILSEYIFPRIIGWTVYGGLQVSRDHNEETMDGQYYYYKRNISKFDQNSIIVGGSYGHAFSLSLQWNTDVIIDVPVYGKQNRVGKSLNSTLYYQLGEKVGNRFSIEYANTNRMSTSSVNPGVGFAFTNYIVIRNTVHYFIENNVNFSVGFDYTDQLSINEFSSIKNRNTSSGLNINFGVNYRFF